MIVVLDAESVLKYVLYTTLKCEKVARQNVIHPKQPAVNIRIGTNNALDVYVVTMLVLSALSSMVDLHVVKVSISIPIFH